MNNNFFLLTDDAHEYHPKVWASMRWFAKLTGCPNLDLVRIKIQNNYCQVYGGFKYYPYDEEKITWITPYRSNLDYIIDQEMVGVHWKWDEDEFRRMNFYKKKKIPSEFLTISGTNLINPDYQDGKNYNKFTPFELYDFSNICSDNLQAQKKLDAIELLLQNS